MKKILVAAAGLAAILFASCCPYVNYDTVDTPNAKLYALPGVNVITIKDTGKGFSYEVFKTVGDAVEDKLGTYKAGTVTDSNIYLPETDYSYRIVAVQSAGSKDKYLVDRTAETTVSMKTPALMKAEETDTKGKFAPYGTDFLNLAKYESNYDEKAEVLSADTIKVEVIPSDNYSVIVTFPTKQYADYTVEYGDVGALEPGRGTAVKSQTVLVDGLKAAGKGYVKFDSIGNNEKEVRVIATPKNNAAYKKSYVTASTKVQIKKASFSIANPEAVRTSKDTVRVSFDEIKFANVIIPVTSFKVYMGTNYSNKSEKDYNDVVVDTAAVIKHDPIDGKYFADIAVAKDTTGTVTTQFYIVGIYNDEWVSSKDINITDKSNYGFVTPSIDSVSLNISQAVVDNKRADTMLIKGVVTCDRAANYTAKLYIGKFDTEAKAKAAYFTECTEVEAITPVVSPITQSTSIVDGVDKFSITASYEKLQSACGAGMTATVDTTGKATKAVSTGAYYKIYFVVTETGKAPVVKSAVKYFTKVEAAGIDPVWSLN